MGGFVFAALHEAAIDPKETFPDAVVGRQITLHPVMGERQVTTHSDHPRYWPILRDRHKSPTYDQTGFASLVEHGENQISTERRQPRKDEMDLPNTSFTTCPIDFLCSTDGPAWAAWVLVAWIVLMVTVGLIGAILVSRQ